MFNDLYRYRHPNVKNTTADITIKGYNRVLQFKQEAWLKPYIEKNTALRAAATNDFEKNVVKLMKTKSSASEPRLKEKIKSHTNTYHSRKHKETSISKHKKR